MSHRGHVASRPSSVINCLAFITNPSNVDLADKVFNNVPRKHIGIYFGGLIWHHSNNQHRVGSLESEFVNGGRNGA